MKNIGCAVVASLMVMAGCSKSNTAGSREPSAAANEQEHQTHATYGESGPGATHEEHVPPGEVMGREEPGTPTTPGRPGAPTQPGTPTQPGATSPQGNQAPVMSQEEIGRRFDDLIAAFNAKDVTALSAFFADDAQTKIDGSDQQFTGSKEVTEKLFQPQLWSAFPDLKVARQLAIVDGTTIMAIVHVTGTNQGPVMSSGPTNKSIGLYGVVHIAFNAEGKVTAQQLVFDPGVAMVQLGLLRKPSLPARAVDAKGWDEENRATVVSTGSADESANLAKVKGADAAFAAANIDESLANAADDIVWTDYSMPKDVKGKKDVRKLFQDFHAAFTDFRILNTSYHAAGPYVVGMIDYSMTSAGNPKQKGQRPGNSVTATDHFFYRFENGKISHVWVVHNGFAMAQQLGLVASGNQPAETPGKGHKHKGK
jgi:ketosteroid isomerase-like protein